MFEYLLIAVAFLVLIGVPAVRAGSRRQQQVTRNDNSYNATDSSGSIWSFGDSSTPGSDSGSCSSDSSSSGDSSSGGDCGGGDSGGGGSD